MPKFRRIPEVITAHQWFPGKHIHGVVEEDRQIGSFYAHAWVTSREGVKAVQPGDWIVMGGDEIPPIPDSIFKTLYEPEPPSVEPIDLEDDSTIAKVETVRLVKRQVLGT